MSRRLLPMQKIVDGYRAGLSSGELAVRYAGRPGSILTLLRRVGEPRRTAREAHALCVSKGRWQPPWRGKRLSREHRAKIGRSGPCNARWMTGRWARPWRQLPKVECAWCGATRQLCNVHRNNDYTDWREANRIVLCVSCHRRHRKLEWWRWQKAGERQPAFNGPNGWFHGRHRATATRESDLVAADSRLYAASKT